MLSAVAAALLASAAPAQESTFCERMAEIWPSHQARRKDGGTIYIVRLKTTNKQQLSYERARSQEPRTPPCSTTRYGARCDLIGPGVFQVGTGKFTRRFAVHEGERVLFRTNVRAVSCYDVPAGLALPDGAVPEPQE